jgi:hypothetical protein
MAEVHCWGFNHVRLLADSEAKVTGTQSRWPNLCNPHLRTIRCEGPGKKLTMTQSDFVRQVCKNRPGAKDLERRAPILWQLIGGGSEAFGGSTAKVLAKNLKRQALILRQLIGGGSGASSGGTAEVQVMSGSKFRHINL